MTDMNLQNVHGLWIGSQLGPMQLLTIRSFLAHGFRFHLWTYDTAIFDATLDDGVVVKDANTIIARERVFVYPAGGPIDVPFGEGSYAGFSDIFRYKLLYEHGGWYTDMDVTCLRHVDFTTEFVFRDHWLLPVVGNIMRCPPKSILMDRCYRLANRVVDQWNDDWHKPIRIMCRYIEELGLSQFVRQGICNVDDSAEIVLKFIRGNCAIPKSWYFLHWCSAMSGADLQKDSTYCELLELYGCATVA
jgi:hypothetical protein